MCRHHSPSHTNYSILCTFILFLISLPCYSQHTASELIDSLTRTTQVEQRISLFNEIAWLYRIKSPDKAITYADSARMVSSANRKFKKLATAYNRFGSIYSEKNDLVTAEIYYDSALKLEESIDNPLGIGRASHQLAIVNQELGLYSPSIDYSQRAIGIYESLKDTFRLSTALNVAGNTFKYLSLFDSSAYYLNRGLDLRIASGSLNGQAESLLSLGSLYDVMDNHDRSLEFNEKAFLLSKAQDMKEESAMALNNMGNSFLAKSLFEDAEESYRESLNIHKSRNDSTAIAVLLNNLGTLYSTQGELDKAEQYEQMALNIWKAIERPESINTYYNLGKIYALRGDHDKALSYFETGLAKADSLDVINNHNYLLREISSSYEIQGDYPSANEYRKRYAKTLKNINQKLILTDNLIREQERLRSKTRLLQSENDRKKIENEKKLTTIYALSGGILLLILLFFTIYRLSQLRNKNALSKKNEQIQKQEIEQLMKTKEVDAMNAMFEGQESERLRIARDLHDRLGATLSIVKMHFKSVEEGIRALKATNVKQYQDANQLLDEACDEVRKIAHDMSSGVLMKFGLVPALHDLKTTVEATGQLKVSLIDIGLDERLSYDHEINIYRIIQELLTNTLKHAKATEIAIQLFRKNSRLSIVVEDDGAGFDPKLLAQKEGMGISNIKSRVLKLNGQVNVDSGRGAGTTVTIELLMENDEL